MNFLFLVVLLGCTEKVSSVEKTNPTNTSTIQEVDSLKIQNQILESVAAINAIDSIIVKTKDLFGYSAEGGEARFGVYRGDTLKIEAIYYGEYGKAEDSYFFNKSSLIYMESRTIYYDRGIFEDNEVQYDSLEVEKFYFQDERLFAWFNKSGIRVDPKSKEFGEKNTIGDISFLLED